MIKGDCYFLGVHIRLLTRCKILDVASSLKIIFKSLKNLDNYFFSASVGPMRVKYSLNWLEISFGTVSLNFANSIMLLIILPENDIDDCPRLLWNAIFYHCQLKFISIKTQFCLS